VYITQNVTIVSHCTTQIYELPCKMDWWEIKINYYILCCFKYE